MRELLATPPLPAAESDVTIVSMVCHGEVRMYLLALKSFVRQMQQSPKVVVLSDGSLTAEDAALLRTHVPSISLVEIASIATGTCPKGGCWERLLLICDLVKDGYVVQLDSDTLTSQPIPEVLACIAENRCFTLLGDRSYPRVQPMLEAWEGLRSNRSSQPQAVCERNFDKLPEAKELLYLRGNAGFVGFARNSISRERVAWFSDLMRRIAEGTWDQWGSEQLTSNLLIANAEGSLPLPFPKYCSYWAHHDVDYSASAFIHFIGPFRYANGLYRKSAEKVLRALQS
jgi:hypothetical protein